MVWSFLDSSFGFPCLCTGITRPTFQNIGTIALFTERFMVSVWYLSAMVPGLCRCFGAILSGPSALFFFLSFIASFTVFHLNFLPSISTSFIAFTVFLFCFSFLFVVWTLLLLIIVGAFPWIMVRSSPLSVKLYASICR